jgi:hypothetical protein
VFLAISFVYFALSPGSVIEQGYMDEMLTGTLTLAGNLASWITRSHRVLLLRIPRHGLLEPILELPFVSVSHLLFGRSPEWADRFLSFESVLETALLCTLVFIWTRKITANSAWGLILALVAGFSTMLWPYAYINMETTQSLFVMLSAYLALGHEYKRTSLRAIAFALSCGVAVSVKANGIFLIPSIGFLILAYFRSDDSRKWPRSRPYLLKTAAIVALAAVLFCLSAYSRWARFRPTAAAGMLSDYGVGPVRYLLNLLSYFTSMNKGLLVFCPVTLLCLLSLKRAAKEDRLIVTFALLTLGGMVLAGSLLYWWSDEVWGSRYLHCTVAPLVICLALAKKRVTFRPRRELALIGLSCCGLVISLLGSLFVYTSLPIVEIRTGTHSIEQLQYDVNWNAIWFNLRLTRLWLRGPRQPPPPDDYWPPPLHNWPKIPEDQAKLDFKPVDLNEWAVPQSFLITKWRKWESPAEVALWSFYLASLLAGPVLLGHIGFKIVARRDLEAVATESPPAEQSPREPQPPYTLEDD